jgi:outer membrane phospholipase A
MHRRFLCFRTGLFLGGLMLTLAGRAEVTRLLQSPPAPVPAGATAVIVLYLVNDGSSAVTEEVPATIPLLAATPFGARAFALRRADSEPEELVVPPDGFRRAQYVIDVPAGVRGLGVLAAEDPRYGRFTVEVVAPVEPAAPVRIAPASPVTQAPGGGKAPAPLPARLRLAVLPDEPVYFSIGARERVNVRFQLSMKVRPFGPADERVYQPGSFFGNLYGSYTQTSIWDLESESRPFFDTSYKPGLYYLRHDTGLNLLGAQVGYAAGFEHESNGQGGALSRSMNLAVFRPTLRWERADGWTLVFSPKLYAYLEKEENPELPDFRGYGDYVFWVEHPDSWKIATTFRLGTTGKSSVLIDASYPFRKIMGSHGPTGWANGYLHLQYFNGYAGSLRTYNQRLPWQLRLGFMVVR